MAKRLKKGGFVKILRLGADLVPKCRNESNGRRVKSAHIFKCYRLENVGVGQIGILFTFSGCGQFSRCTGRIAMEIGHSQRTVDGNVPGERLTLLPRIKPSGLL